MVTEHDELPPHAYEMQARAFVTWILPYLPLICGLIGILVGGGVLYGWTFDIEILKRLNLAWRPMTPITALCLMLLGLALFSHGSSRALWLRAGAGTIVLILETIKLVAFLQGEATFVDSLLFATKMQTGVSIAPNTAAALALLALATIALSGATARFNAIGRLCEISSAFIAVLALIGYAAGVFGFYQIGGDIPMRLHTAITIAILAGGLLFLRDRHTAPDIDETGDKLPLNSAFIATIFSVLLLILSATFWGERQSSTTADLAFQTQTRALETTEILSTLQDAELGQRGYLVTQDESFLAPYNAAISKIALLGAYLEYLRANDPATAPHIPHLQELISQRMAILN